MTCSCDRCVALMLEVPTTDPGPHEALEAGDVCRLIQRAIALLPERAERVLRLRFGIGLKGSEALTLQDAGDMLGISASAVWAMEHRAISALRSQGPTYYSPQLSSAGRDLRELL